MPWRLSLKVLRVELASYAIVALALSIAAGAATLALRSVSISGACLRLFDGRAYTASDMRGCDGAAAFGAVNGSWAGWIMASMAILPLLGGAIVGSQLVAREVDAGTAQWAWSLGLSRRRWLAQRALPVVAFLIVVTAVPALAAWLLEAARNPTTDPNVTFLDYGLRGPLVVWRVVIAFSISLAIGSVLGRSLPALLASVGTSAIALLLLMATLGWGETPVAVPSREVTDRAGYIVVSSGWQAPDGTILSEESARATSPSPHDAEVTIAWLVSHFREVTFIIPGDRLQDVERREIAALAIMSILGFAATGVVIERRRPY